MVYDVVNKIGNDYAQTKRDRLVTNLFTNIILLKHHQQVF